MTKIIGLTGGIGSGKSTIARMFQQHGVPVYIADEEAKKLMDLPETIQKIQTFFGTEIVLSGKIDRKKLAQIVFQNPDKLQILNGIVHPLVKKHFDAWVALHADFPFLVKEVAILFESGSYKDCDQIITVVAPEDVRISRVMQRDGASEQEVKARIRNQWTDAQRIALSDFVINNENPLETEKQFLQILNILSNPH
ncbi:dephospho-CoA kinase [Flavobacterium sp.]|uniref:dephospho-CoA kinase n=1 Tax=Flavobacterium sp. TaxID=239 RepID=UPI003D108096